MATAQSSTGKHFTITAMVTCALLLVNIDITAVNIAIPVLTDQFQIPVDTSVLVIVAYLLAIAGTLLIFGKINDLGYTNQLFTAGFWVFMGGSLLCALAWNYPVLLLFRFVQGIGAAMFLTTYAMVIKNNIPPRNLGKAYGVIGIASGAGYAIGLFLGGMLVTWFGWQAIFWINLPVCLIGLLICRMYLAPSSPKPNVDKKFDWLGAVLSFSGFVVLVYALHIAYENNTFHWMALIDLMISFLLLALFVVVQLYSRSPLINPAILRRRSICLTLFSIVMFLIVENTSCLLFPLYLIEALQYNPMQAGRLLMIPALLTLLFSPVAGMSVDRFGARNISILSAVAFVIAVGLLATFSLHVSLIYLMVIFALYGIVNAFFGSAAMTFLMAQTNAENTGSVSSIKSLLPIVFGMAATIVYGSFYTYFKQVASGSPQSKAQFAYTNEMILSTTLCLLPIILLLLTSHHSSNE